MAAYYNEFDPHAAAWLRELVRGGHIAAGDVDERSIVDVRPDDLRGYRQCHFFAGIGVWSYALRQAGWADDREVWTGSCPCQPFSDAGKGEAFDDERDLWPAFFALIRECRPVVVIGEQVASRLGLAWIDALHADLEGEAYTVGAVDTCSAGFGSPNIRQRLYWLADANQAGQREQRSEGLPGNGDAPQRRDAHRRDEACGLGKPSSTGLEGLTGYGDDRDQPGRVGADQAGSIAEAGEPRGVADCLGDGRDSRSDEGRSARSTHGANAERCGESYRLGDASSGGRRERGHEAFAWGGGHAHRADQSDRPGPVNGFWRNADWLRCTDGRWRPVESGARPLVTGAPARLVRLRGYGNGLNAQAATEFIRAYRSVTE